MKRCCSCDYITTLIKSVTILFVYSFFFPSCTKEAVVQTDAPQPIQNLVEENKLLTSNGCGCHPYIKQYIWRNKNVYVTGINDALNIGFVCDWIPSFYDEAGKLFEIDGSYRFDKYQDFLRTSRFIKTVWACE